MYRLYQSNKNPRHDGGDDEAVDPLPAPFYGDEMYVENGIPFQVTVQEAVGDEPSALGDGSAVAFHRDFEDLWRALEEEAIRRGWRHIEPGQVEDAIANANAKIGDAGEDDEDEVTEWGINSIPPNIIDPGYGNSNPPNVASRAPQTPVSRDLREARPSFQSSNNETPIHANYDRWQTDDSKTGSDKPAAKRKSAPSNNLQDEVPPAAAERPRMDDDPGPQLAQARRGKTPPRSVEEEEWQIPPASFFECTDSRARYISAGIIKPGKATNLGIELKAAADGAVEIEHIASDGYLFVCGTPLRVGDKITGIKTSRASYTCGHIGGMRKSEIVRLLRKSTGRLTIIAENTSGDPNRIECMTSKPHPEFGTGIFFLSGSPGADNILQIHSVPSNGLFANSLLHREARVLSINGVDCTELDACVATDIVKSAPRYVSIVAESAQSVSVDYAVNPAAHLRSVPESDGSERRSSFGVFRRRNGANKTEEGSDHSPRSVDC